MPLQNIESLYTWEWFSWKFNLSTPENVRKNLCPHTRIPPKAGGNFARQASVEKTELPTKETLAHQASAKKNPDSLFSNTVYNYSYNFLILLTSIFLSKEHIES